MRSLLLLLALPALLPAVDSRPEWSTSKVTGSPEPPPPYQVAHVFSKLKFDHPLLMARIPGTDRLFVGEEAGAIFSFDNKSDATAAPFFDLRKQLTTIKQTPDATDVGKLYGLAFHPKFAENRYCYICYTLRGADRKQRNLPEGTRVSRFTVAKTDPPTVDPSSEQIVITFLEGGHNGGDIHFGPDGMLYITTGDAANPNPPDIHNTGQDISDLLASILRIDVDHPDKGMNYGIPRENPFVGMKNARGEVWSYGFRNPWRMSFDRKTGELFVGDVGWELWEMIYRIEKGANYGWSAMEGPQPVKPDKRGPTPIRPPLIELSHAIACSVTGGFVYRGSKFPELAGQYIFGDWETRRLWAAKFEGDRVIAMPELTKPVCRVVAFGEDAAGEIYFLDYDSGTVHTLERSPTGGVNNAFPKTLSATGLFASVKEQRPQPGVLPYEVNAAMWQDGASASRYVALPGNSAATMFPKGKPIPGNVDWRKFRIHFPEDAVLARTLTLHEKPVETQLLHFDGVDWNPYSFAWRDDGSDADLVPAEGTEKEFTINKQKETWQYHSRSQCMSCHNHSVEYILGFSPEQMNRKDQLIRFTQNRLIQRRDDDNNLQPAFDADSLKDKPKLAEPFNDKEPLEARARAYLHVNCGHCHSDGGGGSVELRLHIGKSLADMKARDVRPQRGDFGLPDARLIKPGDPYASTLYYRMAKFGKDRMPHLGAELPDEAGLALIEKWILDGAKKPDVAGNGFGDVASAMQTARVLAHGDADKRRELLAIAAKLPPGPTRDLVEGYLPRDPNAEPKLGSNPRPRAILLKEGNAARGEKLFWSKALNCGSCHKIGEQGIAVGPELTLIGKQRSREELLESMLLPSRKIDPKFSSFTVRTADGKTLTGLVVKRDSRALVLRDAQNKETIIASEDVEELRPSPISLMPDGQLGGLTAQEAADILDYLLTKR